MKQRDREQVLTERTREALRSIARYTHRAWGREQRKKYVAALYARFAFLAKSPHKGRPCDHLSQGMRSYQEGSHVIFYLIEKKNILIVDILHERMDIETRKESWTQH